MKVFIAKSFDVNGNGGDFIVLATSEKEVKEKLQSVLRKNYNHEPVRISVTEVEKEVTLIGSY